jgi:hypothetical protein
MLRMLLFTLGIDQDVINKDHDKLVQLQHEYGVHQVHEMSRSIGECHTRFLHQNHVLIVCMTQDQLFHSYGQKGSQITKCHK